MPQIWVAIMSSVSIYHNRPPAVPTRINPLIFVRLHIFPARNLRPRVCVIFRVRVVGCVDFNAFWRVDLAAVGTAFCGRGRNQTAASVKPEIAALFDIVAK